MNIALQKYEIEVLAQWHRDRQWDAADKSDYLSAQEYKKRADDLFAIAANYHA